jgi:DNA-binding XRE family transcriptional regulator
MQRKRRKTRDAVQIFHRRFYDGKPDMLAGLAEARASAAIAREVYALREKAGLTQRELAKLVKTTPSVICRLEDDDYEGHSLNMLFRIAYALGKRVEVRFLPLKPKAKRA